MPPRLNPGWQMLDCTGLEGSIHYRRGQLVIHKGEECVSEVPLSRIAVVLVGSKVSISGAVLMKLREYDVCLQVCDWKGSLLPYYTQCPRTRVSQHATVLKQTCRYLGRKLRGRRWFAQKSSVKPTYCLRWGPPLSPSGN